MIPLPVRPQPLRLQPRAHDLRASVEIPAADCSNLKKIVIDAQTDITSVANGTVTKELEVSPGLCK